MKAISVLILTIIILLTYHSAFSQVQDTVSLDKSVEKEYSKGTRVVNQCTPWHHMKCIYITGTEVYRDGRAGKSTRHWWRKSYIGQACTDRYGKVFGDIFEAAFVVPHYAGVAFGNGCGFLVRALRGPETKKDKKLREQTSIVD